MNRKTWARLLANALGNAQPSPDTVRWIVAWTAQENTKAKNNPLATTQKGFNAQSDFNSVGVKNYATTRDGLDATVKTLSYDFPGYSDIREGIRTNDPNRAMKGLYAAPWGSNAASVDLIYKSGIDRGDEELPSISGIDGSAIAPGQMTRNRPSERADEMNAALGGAIQDTLFDRLGIPEISESDWQLAGKTVLGVVFIAAGLAIMYRTALADTALQAVQVAAAVV